MIIIEDFAPFELAVKLKEKGFDCSCIGHYVNNQLYIAHYLNAFHSDKDESLDAPTISQVLKWLREKKIHLVVDIEPNGYFFIINYNITTTFDDKYEFDIYNSLSCYNDDKQAFIAGIEYVLDNLI